MESKIIQIPKAAEVERQIGIDASNRKQVLEVLRRMMRTFRAVLKRNTEIYYPAYPKTRRPCATCAFAVKTRRLRGFLATTHGLMSSVVTPKPFVCHDNQPLHCENQIEQHRLMVCLGFALVAHEDKVKKAAITANAEITALLRKSANAKLTQTEPKSAAETSAVVL